MQDGAGKSSRGPQVTDGFAAVILPKHQADFSSYVTGWRRSLGDTSVRMPAQKSTVKCLRFDSYF